MTRVRFALAGTGAMAERMLETLKLIPELSVDFVASRDLARSQAFVLKNGLQANAITYDGLSNTAGIDALYIASTNEHHTTIAQIALANRIAVLIEKPLTTSYETTKSLVGLAQKNKVLLMEALWTKFIPAYRSYVETVRSNQFGPIGLFRADFGYRNATDGAAPINSANHGVIADRLIYPLALSLDLLGGITRIDAATGNPAGSFDSHVAVQLSHAAGGLSQLVVSRDVQLSNEATAYCRDATICLAEPLLGSEAVKMRMTYPISVTGSARPSKIKAALKQSSLLRSLAAKRQRFSVQPLPYGKDQYLPMMMHFLGLMKTGTHESDVHPLSATLELAQLLENVRGKIYSHG